MTTTPFDNLFPFGTEFMSLRRAAEVFGVDVRTFRRWVRSGRIRACRTSPRGSGRVFFEKAELIRLWESMRQPPPGAGV